tara:strand:- start:4442 stop:4717 length:276 start_codon:yes stop_codon:yes gene_type:complete
VCYFRLSKREEKVKNIFIDPESLKGRKDDYNPLEDEPLKSRTIEERMESVEQKIQELFMLQKHMLDYLNEVMSTFVEKFDVDHEFDTDSEK